MGQLRHPAKFKCMIEVRERELATLNLGYARCSTYLEPRYIGILKSQLPLLLQQL